MDAKPSKWNLPHPAVDSHFHLLEMKKRGLEIPALVVEASSRGLLGGMDAAVDETGYDMRESLIKALRGFRLSAGIHPSSAGGAIDVRMAEVRRQTARSLVTAIGETGLDFYRDMVERSVQEEWFARHLALSRETGLPVIIHNRDADDRIIALVERERPAGGVLHCFSSHPDMAERGLAAGLYISFAGNVTYKRSDMIREAAALVPAERLLVETDSPYLSPQEVRGKLNHPGHIGFTLGMLAEVRGETPEEVAGYTMENAHNLLGIGGEV